MSPDDDAAPDHPGGQGGHFQVPQSPHQPLPALGEPSRPLRALGDRAETATRQRHLTQELRDALGPDLQVPVGRHGKEPGARHAHRLRPPRTLVRQDSNPVESSP
ncbi:hypothetical protein [Streptomyces violarus]|uniref:hypothetical protein n=1 Tax=Streptomyces violarus TaxID=67380 RepID=UPI0021BEFD39|nr:hypothetical protein [Streptomyces violarus]MCT9145353.1 hypothetical protein [Streptomyces violarus]